MIGNNEARRLQKTRKTTAKMGGLCIERSEKGRGAGKWREKVNNRGPMHFFYTRSRAVNLQLDQPHPYQTETRGRTNCDQVTRFGRC